MLDLTLHIKPATELTPGQRELVRDLSDHVVLVSFSQLEHLGGLAARAFSAVVIDDDGRGLIGSARSHPIGEALQHMMEAVCPPEREPCRHFTATQKADFKRIVLDHIQSRLDRDEWASFRERAANQSRWAGGPFYPDATPAELVEKATTEDTMPITALSKHGTAQALVAVDGQPVLFFPRSGIFAWAPSDESPSLMLWLTDPAFPPGW